jgi:hypothetical protein
LLLNFSLSPRHFSSFSFLSRFPIFTFSIWSLLLLPLSLYSYFLNMINLTTKYRLFKYYLTTFID